LKREAAQGRRSREDLAAGERADARQSENKRWGMRNY
jgi:hypothetical protein